MAEDSETVNIECELGAMSLSVEAPSDDATQIFNKIWEARLEERRESETIEYQHLSDCIRTEEN